MKTRIVIADDHQMVREGLRSLIDSHDGMDVVGEAENGKATVDMVQNLAPHVVIMDVSMPDLNGIEATRQIIRTRAKTRVVGLSAHADRHFVAEMLKAGASAYLLKHSAFEELTHTIEAVMQGKTYLSPEVAGGLVDDFVRASPGKNENPAFAVLTERERQVLQLLAEGMTTKEMAGELSVSVKTIETHRRNIMEKLDLHSIAELTKYAIREGVTSLDS